MIYSAAGWLYYWLGIAGTVNFDHIKRGYYDIPTAYSRRIVPIGPEINLTGPHGRDGLEGRGIATS